MNDFLLAPQGPMQALDGFRLKTLPALLRVHRVGLPRLAAIFLRVLLLVGAALFPLVVRKSLSIKEPDPELLQLLSGWKTIDVLLGLIALFLVFVPKALDLFERPSPHKGLNPNDELAAAIAKMPPIDSNGAGRDGVGAPAIGTAIECALRGLRDEMRELVGDFPDRLSIEVALLVFADPDGLTMCVQNRTVPTDPCMRKVNSSDLLAYHAAVTGRPLMENDFLNKRNPYPKKRITVPGGQPVEYRSVMYLPITWGQRPEIANANPADNSGVIDVALGVVCVHCKGPFRFWRWGDQKRGGGAFGTVAYARSSPYIALLARLLEREAIKVKVEEP